MPRDILRCLQETVEYWRKFVPEDGLSLDKLIDIDKPVQEKGNIVALDVKNSKQITVDLTREV